MNNDSADLWIAVQLVGARLVVALFVLDQHGWIRAIRMQADMPHELRPFCV